MDQDVKDILVDGDQLPDTTDAITKAVAAYKEQIARKDAEAKHLREQYDRVAKMADERGQEATKAQADLHGMTQYTRQAEQAAIANALAAAQAEATQMQADLAAAIETADGKRAAELQRKMTTELGPRIHDLQRGKDKIEEEIAQHKDAPPPQPRQSAAVAADPYEAMLAGSVLTELQKEWARKHRDKGYFAPDKQPTSKFLKAYHGAVDAGLREDSPAFLVYMDRILGHTTAQPAAQAAAPRTGEQQQGDASERFADGGATQPAAQPVAQPAAKRAIPAAPPSRAPSGNNAGGAPRVTLTREQHHTAQRLGMTPAEYANGIKEGIRRGKIPASFLQQT